MEKVISSKFCEISKNTFFYRIPLVAASEMPRIKYNFNKKVDFEYHLILWRSYEETLQEKMRLSIKDFFSKCDQIRSFQRIWSHLLKKSWMENLIFCAVRCREKDPWNFITILKNYYNPRKIYKKNAREGVYLEQSWSRASLFSTSIFRYFHNVMILELLRKTGRDGWY